MTADELLIKLGSLGVAVFANGDALELVRPGGQGVPARLAEEARLSHQEIKALLNRAAEGFYRPPGRGRPRVPINGRGTTVLEVSGRPK
jgi:hypothetical protein